MKKFSLALVVVMLISCVSCGKPQDVDSNQTDVSAEKQVLNCSWNDEPTSMDLMKYSGVVDLKLIWNLYEPLVRIEDGKVVSAGAKSWEISEDGLTYTFLLQDNCWSDGKEVTASDYATMLRRAADPATGFAYASDFYIIKNFEAVNTGGLDLGELGVVVENEKTLIINLEYPSNTFLSSVEIYPERADFIEQCGDQYGYSPETMIFCGPYKMTNWTHNSTIKLEKNETYWDQGNVRIDEVNLHIIPDEATRLMSFQSGEIDFVSVSDENYINEFRNNSDMYEEIAQSARTYMFLFNCKDELFKNIKVRQAFSLAINREEISNSLDNGMTTPAYGLIPPTTAVGQFDYRNQVEEPLKALSESTSDVKSLLCEGLQKLGLSTDPAEITITLSCPNDSASQEMAEYYKAMWEANLGITIEIDMQEFATYRSLIWSDEYQIATTAWGGSIEPQFMLSRWFPDNQSQWDNDEYTQLVTLGAQTADDQSRLDYYAAAEQMLITDCAVIAPIKYDGYLVFYYNYVQGNDNNPFSNVGFKCMHLEK